MSSASIIFLSFRYFFNKQNSFNVPNKFAYESINTFGTLLLFIHRIFRKYRKVAVMHMICRHSGTGNFLTRSLIENKRPLKRNLIRTFTSPTNGLKTNAPVATTTTQSHLSDDVLKERAREIDLCYNKLDLSFENAKEALKVSEFDFYINFR